MTCALINLIFKFFCHIGLLCDIDLIQAMLMKNVGGIMLSSRVQAGT